MGDGVMGIFLLKTAEHLNGLSLTANTAWPPFQSHRRLLKDGSVADPLGLPHTLSGPDLPHRWQWLSGTGILIHQFANQR